MFSAPGYVVLARIDLLFRAAGKELHPLPPQPGADDSEANFTRHERSVSAIIDRRSKETTLALRAFLAQCPSLSVCFADGKVLRVSPSIVHWTPSHRLVPQTDFWFVDRKTWIIETDRAVRWLAWCEAEIMRTSVYAKALQKLAPKRESDISKYNLKRGALESARGRLSVLVEGINPLVGAALTIAEADTPTAGSVARYFEKSAQVDLDDDDEAHAGGRPEKQGPALDVFWELFPGGHKTATWKEITTAVSGRLGYPVGVDTIRRALGLRREGPSRRVAAEGGGTKTRRSRTIPWQTPPKVLQD